MCFAVEHVEERLTVEDAVSESRVDLHNQVFLLRFLDEVLDDQAAVFNIFEAVFFYY